MATAQREAQQREFVRRAARTGAAVRARKRKGVSLSDAARALHVDNATYYRWETGKSTPTHHGNLAAFARHLKRIGVDEDPGMAEEA